MNKLNDQARQGLFGLPACAAILLLSTATAQVAMAQQDSGTKKDSEAIEEVIVTGTAGGAELRKFDASFAITTADSDAINKFSPKSTADLLKLVPGVWAESSGGVAGANVFVRGFPGGGDAPYLTVQLNGSPVFPPPTLSFLENSTLFRLDETIDHMEALRGGPNPVFSNGQPGLTTNFILREGGPETEGLVKYTTSDYDLRRFDGYLSGELGDEFYYMIGGYLSSSPGIRDAGFNAAEGQQLTVNLTKDFDNGSINFYHRATDDHGTWYLPASLNVPGIDASYTQIGPLNRQRQITYGPDGATKTLDLGQGRGWDGAITGGSIKLEFADNWELTDRFNYTAGDANTLGLVPAGGAVNVGMLMADPDVDPNAVVTAAQLTGAVTGRAISSAEYIQTFGAWEVLKNIEAFTNDLSIAYSWDRGSVTGGYYSANSSTDEWWSIGNGKYMVVAPGGEMVNGIACNEPDVDNCPGDFSYDLNATGDATTNALYVAGTFYVTDDLTFDVGVRSENHQVNYSVDEGLDGQVTKSVNDYDKTEISYTAAVNYMFTDEIGAFARINDGHRMPYFDDFRDIYDSYTGGNDLIQDVEQYELGFKFVTDSISLYATGFHTAVDPSVFVPLTGGGNAQVARNEANGLEIDGTWFSDFGLSVTLNATIQDTEIKNGADAGNQAQRQPPWQLRVSPSYDFMIGETPVTLYGTVTSVDDRYSDNGNTVVLPSFNKVDLGVIARINERLNIQLAADNLTDEDALTEGDPRNPAAPNGRYIMPRNVKLSVGYEF